MVRQNVSIINIILMVRQNVSIINIILMVRQNVSIINIILMVRQNMSIINIILSGLNFISRKLQQTYSGTGYHTHMFIAYGI